MLPQQEHPLRILSHNQPSLQPLTLGWQIQHHHRILVYTTCFKYRVSIHLYQGSAITLSSASDTKGEPGETSYRRHETVGVETENMEKIRDKKGGRAFQYTHMFNK